MPDFWTFPAPCKLNLFLHITGQRDDGYHSLETLLQLLDWGDSLEFGVADKISFEQDPSMDIPEEENLVFRAAKLLADAIHCEQGIHIRLKKNIPAGAGLGGGSSDAATTLIALNEIWGLQLSVPELSKLGLALGADVPVFIAGRTALATGIGEELTPINMPENWFLVVTPRVHIATAKIFSHPQLTRDSSALFSTESSPLLTGGISPSKMCARAVQEGRNDCRTVVEMLHLEVASLRKTLEKFTPTWMSGTGSSLFAQFEQYKDAEQMAAKLVEEGPKELSFFIAQGVNRSPVHQSVRRLKGH